MTKMTDNNQLPEISIRFTPNEDMNSFESSVKMNNAAILYLGETIESEVMLNTNEDDIPKNHKAAMALIVGIITNKLFTFNTDFNNANEKKIH